MKRYCFIILVLIMLMPYSLIYASDTSNAEYLSKITVSNSGNEASNECVVFTLLTSAMISYGMLSDNASDCAMLTSPSGSDLPFMPSVNSSYPWVTWVNSISADSIINEYLYSKDVTGGTIRYFPGSNGMTIADSATMEPSNNFRLELNDTWLRTTSGYIGEPIYYKGTEITANVTAAGEITVFISPSTNVTATGVSDAEHDLVVWEDGSYLHISIDGVESDNTTAVTVNNTSDNWIIGGDATTYIGEFQFYQSDVQKCGIDWEYGSTFTDSTGNSNHATPSFRTSGSDSDLSATVSSQEALVEGSTANVTYEGWVMPVDTTAPENLFDEGGDTYKVFGFDIGQKITDTANAAGQDKTSWHILFAFGVALVAMIGVYAGTHNIRTMGMRGSLFLSAIVAEGVLIYFYRTLTIPGLALIPFGLIALLLIVWRRTPSPID